MQLKVVTGGQAGKLIAVKHDKFLIGRSDECHLRPKSESISRRHCAIIHKDGRVLLIDLKSRNGTHVNDKKLDPAKAKILKDGDQIRVGKLEFIAVIEAGVGNVKKSEVKDVKEAAARVAANVDDSRYDEVDVSSWLEEADSFERRTEDPETRHFQIENLDSAATEATVMDVGAEQDTAADDVKRRVKSKPGKLPPVPKGPTTGNSKDAASETLRKFFSGR
ncbi:MAG: FHA domain-containing protein [Planctomycetales bacterium]|nr:FHA domain-containing protein [Planctomycetales bacterium]